MDYDDDIATGSNTVIPKIEEVKKPSKKKEEPEQNNFSHTVSKIKAKITKKK